VQGSGTAGTVPVWTGTTTIGNSHIQDNGNTLTLTEPISGGVNVSGAVNVSGPVNAADGSGDIAILAGNGGVGVRGQGSTIGVQGQGETGIEGDGTRYGVHGSGAVGVFGHTDTFNGAGVYGEGPRSGVFGLSPLYGVLGQSDQGLGVLGESSGGTGVEGTTDSGVGVRGQSTSGIGVTGHSTNNHGLTGSTDGLAGGTAGVAGFGLQMGVGVFGSAGTSAIISPVNQVGVVGTCTNLNGGCEGIYGYANPSSGFGHGVVGETSFGPDGAGVIGITHSTGQGVRGGTENAGGIGVVGYNTGGGFAIQSQGDMRVYGNLYLFGNFINNSSRRFKSNIEPMQGALGKVEHLRGVTFNWIESGKHDIGLVAEEVAEVVPEVVGYDKDGVDVQGVDYARLTALLIEAIKEQQAEIKQLRSVMEKLNVHP
jgi:hypothetical protein